MSQLLAFGNDNSKKMSYYDEIEDWLINKNTPISPDKIANKLFSTVKIFKPSDCILERYEEFPEKLGLPMWLSYLLRTINHHNAADGYLETKDYRDFFYQKFILSCNPGIDYTKMLHQWQIIIMTDVLPEGINRHHVVQKTIDLHKQSMAEDVSIERWQELKIEIEKALDTFTEHKSAEYRLMRAAFLSTEEVIDIDNIWTSSVEAIVEIQVNATELNTGGKVNSNIAAKLAWRHIMDDLFVCIGSWQADKL